MHVIGKVVKAVATAVAVVAAEKAAETGTKKLITTETYLRIVNNSNSNIISTQVTETDSFDWSGSGPAGNFQARKIPIGDYWEEREDINFFASNCPFTMLLRFADGSKNKFRINQKFSVGKASAGFSHREGKRKISYARKEGNKLVLTIK